MSSTILLQFLKDFCNEGSEAVLIKGYRWFQETLTPNLREASEKYGTVETALIGEAWLIAGEVHELLYAPNQAVTCYQISLHFNPFSEDTYRWLALVYEQLGDYMEATKNIELALKHTADGVALMEDRQRIQDCIVYDKDPDFQEGNLLWGYNEALTEGKFQAVIKSIQTSKTTDIELLKCLYRAYGGLRDKTKGTETWQQILAIDQDAIRDELDLFYWK